MHARALLGVRGEDAACALYRRAGYHIVERNYRGSNQGEIDIIARRGDLLVFCKVKTRATDYFGLPAEAVGPQKQARLRRLAGRWIAEVKPDHADVRFDVVSVIVRDGRLDVTHIPDAF